VKLNGKPLYVFWSNLHQSTKTQEMKGGWVDQSKTAECKIRHIKNAPTKKWDLKKETS
jgi:hypothetical protein